MKSICRFSRQLSVNFFSNTAYQSKPADRCNLSEGYSTNYDGWSSISEHLHEVTSHIQATDQLSLED